MYFSISMIKDIIPDSIVKNIPEGNITAKSVLIVQCGCGNEFKLQVSSIIRTIKRVGFYRCLSCGMSEKLKDENFRKKLSDSVTASWSSDRKKKQSRISKELWSDSEFKGKQTKTSLDVWADPLKRQESSELTRNSWGEEKRDHYQKVWTEEKRAESSDKISNLWKQPYYVEKQLAAKQSPDHINLQKQLAFDRWKNPEYREAISEATRKIWEDNPNLRAEMSDHVVKLWNDEAYKAKQNAAAVDPILCQLKSDIAKKQWENPAIRKNIIDKLKIVWNSPEYKKISSENSKRRWQDPEYREQQAKIRSNILSNGKDSILERVTQTLLGSLNIDYIRHYPLGYFEFDVFIPSHKLLIECNGEYWHSLRKSLDASKFTYINEYFPDYRILYLWERDFLNPGLIHQKIVKSLDLNGDELLEQNDFSFSDIILKQLSVKDILPGSYYSESEEFLQSFHYAGFGRSAKTIYGACLGDKIIGICKFTSPIRAEAATSMGFTQSQVLELDRFCIHPSYHKKNFASWFMSRCMNDVLKNNHKVKSLISFADSTYDHIGTIYKASNWEFLHEVKSDYHYINQDGFVVHKKTLYDHACRHSQKELDYANLHGYMKVFGRSKKKFCYKRK